MDSSPVEVFGQAFRPDQVPRPRGPEAVFVGRSNVGKSSLVNRLLGRRNIARVSSTPGKTRGAFFYAFEKKGHPALVDLPGYGFAKGARTERAAWEELTITIFERPGERLLVQLVDLRLPMQEIDRLAAEWFDSISGNRRLLAGTKADKLPRSKRAASARRLSEALGAPIVATSAETGDGLRELWNEIETRLGTALHAPRPAAEER